MGITQIKLKIRRALSCIVNSPYYVLGKIKHGAEFTTYGRIIVKAPRGRIVFGDNCIIRSGIATNPLGGTDRVILSVGPEGMVKCGNNVGISNSCIRIKSELLIDDNVNIGGDCKIYDSDMHSIEYEYRMQSPDVHIKTKPIHIKEGAWIGAHSIILKGVTVGRHSVVGAGSVVTKSIPDGELWAGNPACFIRKIDAGTVMEKNTNE